MKVIIAGAGEVGFNIADRLSREGHDVVIVDIDADREMQLRSRLNVMTVLGSGTSVSALTEAGVAKADLFIAVTSIDEINLVSCFLARALGVPRIVARLKGIEYQSDRWRELARSQGIDTIINPTEVVADEIVQSIAYTSASDVAEFAGGKVVFAGYPITPDSPLAGVSLVTVGNIRGIYRMVIAAIKRHQTTIIPRGEDVIQQGDIVFLTCCSADLPQVADLFGFERTQVREIFILGGGPIGQRTAQKLSALKYEVKLVDQDLDRCNRLAELEELEDVRILNTTGTDVETLKSEGLDSADVFVSATKDDQTNILCALLAKQEGVARVAAVVNSPQFLDLAPAVGVDTVISPRLTTAGAILRHVRRGDVVNIAVVDAHDSEVLELHMKADSDKLGQPLKDLRVPEGAIVGAIVRGEQTIIPGGDDVLAADDHVIVFTLPEAIGRVERFFD